MQRASGLIIGCANRVTLISWEAEHTEHQIGQAFIDKNHIVSILHTGYKAIGYNIIYTIQARWVIRGTQMFVLTCFWKNHNFAISTESSVVCAVNGKSTLLQSHAITLPYFASFTRGEVGGGGFRWSFSTDTSPETPRHSWENLGQSLMGSLLLSPGSWWAQGSVVPSRSLFPSAV